MKGVRSIARGFQTEIIGVSSVAEYFQTEMKG